MTAADTSKPRIEIANDAEAGRYSISVDGELAGFTEYRERPRRLAFIHTEIDSRFEGQGLGSRLISFALDDARARNLEILPFCPFVRSYIQRHREYLDLVPEDQRSRFEL